MKAYLETLITEKGKYLDDFIEIDGQIGLDYNMLIEFIEAFPDTHKRIKSRLVHIDLKNGDVFAYLNYIAESMLKSVE